MSIHATATFRVQSWDEKPYDEIDGRGAEADPRQCHQVVHGGH